MPYVLWHQAHLPVRKGFDVAMCPTASDFVSRHGRAPVLPRVPWLQTLPPNTGGLQCRHVSHGSRPASRHGRARASPCATWLSACHGPQGKGEYSAGLLTRPGPPVSEACPCVPKMPDSRLIMTSPSTWSRQHIKCIQDIHT
jgi:hypothetical protein